MIYRKWSLLTGPPAIAGGIVAVVAVINFTCVQNEWLLKRLPGKQVGGSSNK